MTLLQIVPGIAPQIDGIGDYALQLARQLRARHGIGTVFAVCDPEWEGDRLLDGFLIRKITRRTRNGLLELLADCESVAASQTARILLHMSPYGYQKRGVPFWLVNSLERYAQRAPGTVNVCFHELEVTGCHPWSSGFWVPSFQISILRRVAKLGNFLYTNTELHRRKLEEWGASHVELILNFSTIHEPSTLPPFVERRNDLIIFGRAAMRMPLYTVHRKALESLCARLGTERIIDIGSPMEAWTEAEIGGVPIVRCGHLSEQDVSQWIAASIGTFMSYPVKFLSKSSVHAVACAHGTVTFLHELRPDQPSTAGLVTGVDFIPITDDSSSCVLPPLAELCATIYQNYSMRTSAEAADRVASGIRNTLT